MLILVLNPVSKFLFQIILSVLSHVYAVGVDFLSGAIAQAEGKAVEADVLPGLGNLNVHDATSLQVRKKLLGLLVGVGENKRFERNAVSRAWTSWLDARSAEERCC